MKFLELFGGVAFQSARVVEGATNEVIGNAHEYAEHATRAKSRHRGGTERKGTQRNGMSSGEPEAEAEAEGAADASREVNVPTCTKAMPVRDSGTSSEWMQMQTQRAAKRAPTVRERCSRNTRTMSYASTERVTLFDLL